MSEHLNAQPRRYLFLFIEALIVGLIFYLIALPFYPVIKYKFINFQNNRANFSAVDLPSVKSQTENTLLAEKKSGNRLVISKIGVDIPVIEGQSDAALSKGAWRLPESSTPDNGGNTVITGHRFKYLPPSNLTFYLLDKLAPGDIVSLRWQEKIYYYKVREKKIVAANDESILAKSSEPILTLFTCDPIWSEKNRLVVVADLIEDN